jgi:prefoldin subunit 5
VLFDQTQNERGRLDTTYSELGKLLGDNDFDVESYTEFMIMTKKIKDADVMVFGCPNSSKIRPAEIDALTTFVKQGGGLLLLSLSGGDKGLMNNMSQISKGFGISFENTAVKDEQSNAGLPTMPVLKKIEPHPTTEDVTDLLVPSGCTLKVTAKATAIAITSEMADPPNQPVIAVAEPGKGRIMCIGSYEVFRRGGGLKHKGNKTFAVNTFRWLSGEAKYVKPSSVAKKQAKDEESKKSPSEKAKDSIASMEIEKTLKRLVNAVFDLQKDIGKSSEKITKLESNIEALRDQFQDFAEKTQDQLGVMIPAKQFRTEEENKSEEVVGDIKAIESEIKSVEQLRDHIEQRHSSGVMPKETYTEQAEKLDQRLKNLEKKLQKKYTELEKLQE